MTGKKNEAAFENSSRVQKFQVQREPLSRRNLSRVPRFSDTEVHVSALLLVWEKEKETESIGSDTALWKDFCPRPWGLGKQSDWFLHVPLTVHSR